MCRCFPVLSLWNCELRPKQSRPNMNSTVAQDKDKDKDKDNDNDNDNDWAIVRSNNTRH